jgi:glucosyl-dolichyl phosphate glucuronosyltransferase
VAGRDEFHCSDSLSGAGYSRMLESQSGVSAEKCLTNSVTVVVCAYTRDRWMTLQRAIDVALDQISPEDELLVVVDHNDALLARCREYLGDFTVLPNRRNRGLSGARNTALDEAHGSIIVFLDDDAIPLAGWLEALRAPYADERVYGVGGLAKPLWLCGQPGWFPEEFLWVVGCSHRGIPPDPHPVRNLVGANMSFRKAAFEHVGGFAEQMGRIGERLHACEETEFSIRLTQANPDAVILYEPSSQVEHHVAQQRASLGYFVRRCWAEGLSKAEVSRRVGRSRALSAERHYTSQVLPKGIWKGLHDSAAGDLWGAARSVAIVLGLAATVIGYCVGTVFRPSHSSRDAK